MPKLAYNTGVYLITNLLNGKVYVGSAATSFAARWQKHKRDLRKKEHHSRRLQNAWNKYGEQPFVFSRLETCKPDKELLLSREQYWIDYYDAVNPGKGYNNCPIAGSRQGYRYNIEQRVAITKRNRETYRKRAEDPQWKEKMVAQLRGMNKGVSENPVKRARQRVICSRNALLRNMSGGVRTARQLSAMGRRKLSAVQVMEIRHRVATGELLKEVGKDFGICQSSVSLIVNRKQYRGVE